MVDQILLGTQIFQPRWVVFHVFHDSVYGVLSHWSFLVPNAWNQLVDDSEVKRTAFLHFAWSLPRYRLNNMTGHSFPVANILGMRYWSISIWGMGGSEYLGNQWLQNKLPTPSSWLKIDWPTPDRRSKIAGPTPSQQNSCFAKSGLILYYLHVLVHVWISLDLPLLSSHSFS